MTVKLNHAGLTKAKSLIENGHVVRDKRDDWSEAAPTAEQENAFIKKHGIAKAGKTLLKLIDEN